MSFFRGPPRDSALAVSKADHLKEDVVYCLETEVTKRDGRMFVCVEGADVVVEPVTSILVQDDGSRLTLQLSMLDNPAVEACVGQFYKSFEPRCFYWNSVILLRRLAQTGVVVLWQILAAEYALLYAFGVSICAVVAQTHYAPFVDPIMDRVEFLCQLNLLVILYVFVIGEVMDEDKWEEELAHFFLLILQIVLGGYIAWQLTRMMKETIEEAGLVEKVQRTVLGRRMNRALPSKPWMVLNTLFHSTNEDEGKPEPHAVQDSGSACNSDVKAYLMHGNPLSVSEIEDAEGMETVSAPSMDCGAEMEQLTTSHK
eukprot:gene22354-26968_t